MNRNINIGIAAQVGKYSDAVEVVAAQRIVYVSGTPGIDGHSHELPANFAAQAELAWQNVIAILAQVDMRVEDIVKVTHHLLHREDLGAYRDIRARHLQGCEPASMLMFLPALVWPNMLIELEVTAAK
jgi:2-iminobutanoate/2-iminopropanoate deaminase